MKRFNTTGPCFPDEHYMMPALDRLPGVRELVAGGVFGKPLVGVVGPRKNTRLSFEANAVFAYPAGMIVSFY